MKPAIIDIPGIGPAAVAALAEHRIKTLAGLARASVETVSAVPGFSEARAIKIIAAASELLPATPAVKEKAGGKPPKDGNTGKDKKKDKDKKRKEKGKKKDKKNKGKKKDKGKKKGKK